MTRDVAVSLVVGANTSLQEARVAWAVFFIVTVGFVLIAIYLRNWQLDDSYISYRYAQNLADGHGFRWNPSDSGPVEGFTSFLWVVLLASTNFLGASLPAAGATLGIIATLGTMLIVFWNGDPRKTPLIAVLGLLILATHVFILVHAVSGMDTALTMLILTALAAAMVRAVRDQQGRRTVYVLGFLAFMSRPDTAPFIAALIVALVLTAPRDSRTGIIRETGLWLFLPVVVYWLAKAAVFGHLVPTTFQRKQQLSLIDALISEGGLTYAMDFFALSMLGGTMIVVAIWLSGKKVSPVVIALFAAVAVQLAYTVTINPTVGVAGRFLIPFLPAFVIGTLIALQDIGGIKNPRIGYRGWRNSAGAVGLLLIIIFSFDAVNRHEQYTGLEDYFAVRIVNPLVGKALAGITDEPQSVVLLTGEAGVVPFETGFRHVDMLGLTDEHIAFKGFDVDYLHAQRPDIFFTHSVEFEAEPGGAVTVDEAMVRSQFPNFGESLNSFDLGTGFASYSFMLHPEFSNYALAGKLEMGRGAGTNRWAVFVRNDSPVREEVLAAVAGIDLESELADFRARYSVSGLLRALRPR